MKKTRNNRIGIWGQLGPNNFPSDGQAIKTRVLLDSLKKRVGDDNVFVCNTFEWKKRPIRLLWQTINMFFTSNKIFILPANNGFKMIVPFYNFLQFFFRKDIYYIVIGGFLSTMLKEKPKYIRMLKKYKSIHVETVGMKDDLVAIGLNNVGILPNFKSLKARKLDDIVENTDKQVKVISFSRITYTKGIEDAVNAVVKCNQILGEHSIALHLYGMIDPNYTQKFNELLLHNDCVEYKGIVDYQGTVDIIKNYFLMLFPTFYHGEGFAGIIIDTYFSGIPIIATDWMYNKDLIENGVNGYLVKVNSPNEISNKILELYSNRALHKEMSINNIIASEKYSADAVLTNFLDSLDL